MAKNDNLKDLLTDVADAIREKKGTTELINPQDFASEIASIESGGGNGWTGHADAEGLRAIGWTEDDIAYYQENGVDWNEEDDHLHLVSDDNKALYGVLTPHNIDTYKDKIVYLPKISVTGLESLGNKFKDCYNLIAVPHLDTSLATNVRGIFMFCYNLRSVPPLDLRNATTLRYAFYECYSLKSIEIATTSLCTEWREVFYLCTSLRKISKLNIAGATSLLNTFNQCYSLHSIELENSSGVAEWKGAFANMRNAKSIKGLDMLSSTDITSVTTGNCVCEEYEIINLRKDISIESFLLKKDSLLGIVTNAVSDIALTIKLQTNVYDKYANDPDVVEVLANHPNITLAK